MSQALSGSASLDRPGVGRQNTDFLLSRMESRHLTLLPFQKHIKRGKR